MKSILAILIISSGAVHGNKISDANNRVTPDFYTEIAKTQSGNFIFSPLSAETVLTLLQTGTEGDTSQELATVLYLPESKGEIRSEAKSLLTDLQDSQVTTFEIANAAFIQQKFVVKDAFLTIAKDDFFATSQNVDFSQNQEAADTINKYVEDHTNNLIKNLVNPDSLTADTVLVLVNALRFKGNWSIQFPKSATTKEDFTTPDQVIQVDTLHLYEKHLNYYNCPKLEAEFLELPFQGDDASLVIALPKDKDGLAALEEHILAISTYEIPFQSTYVNVALPKFKQETRIDFKQILSALGVNKIFKAAEADLSGIAGNKGDLVVSQVVQKAFIDLNEGGVEAAAATYVGVTVEAVPVDQPIDVIVDHPFIILLKYKQTTIFAGRIVEPQY